MAVNTRYGMELWSPDMLTTPERRGLLLQYWSLLRDAHDSIQIPNGGIYVNSQLEKIRLLVSHGRPERHFLTVPSPHASKGHGRGRGAFYAHGSRVQVSPQCHSRLCHSGRGAGHALWHSLNPKKPVLYCMVGLHAKGVQSRVPTRYGYRKPSLEAQINGKPNGRRKYHRDAHGQPNNQCRAHLRL